MAFKPSILQAFTGGLQTRLAPHIAGTGSALICNNVNFESGILAPFNSPKAFAKATDKNVVWYKNNYSYHEKDSVFCNMLDAGFLATSKGIKKTTDGIRWDNIAIDAPTNVLSVKAGVPDADAYKTVDFIKGNWVEYPSSGKWMIRYQNTEGKDLKIRIVLPALTQSNTDPTIVARNGTKDTNKKWTSTMAVRVSVVKQGAVSSSWAEAEDKIVRTKVTSSQQGSSIEVDKISDDKGLRVSYGTTVLSQTIEENMVSQAEIYADVPDACELWIQVVANDIENKAGEPYNTRAPVPTAFDDAALARIDGTVKLYLFDKSAQNTNGELYGDNYRWCYTYYNANDGTESAPSPYTDATTIGELVETSTSTYWRNSFATLDGIKASRDPQVTNIRIYRIGQGISDFRLVMELPNTDASVVDNVSSYNLGEACTTIGYTVPPIVSYLTTAYGMLFGCKDNILYYSDDGVPTNWDPLNYIVFDDTITGIGPTSAGLLVFTKYRTYIISGNSATNFYKQLLYDNIGCISGKSIVTSGSECVWQGQNGVYLFSNGITNLTLGKIGSTLDTITSACISDGSYFGIMQDKIICISFLLNYAVGYITLANVDNIINAENKPTFIIKGETCTFDGAPMKLEWQSTWLQTGLTLYKNYKSVYVYAEGQMDYEVYIGSTLAASGSLDDGTTTEIKVSQALRTGYYMSFKFIGTGKVYEIQYQSEDRQNVQ